MVIILNEAAICIQSMKLIEEPGKKYIHQVNPNAGLA